MAKRGSTVTSLTAIMLLALAAFSLYFFKESATNISTESNGNFQLKLGRLQVGTLQGLQQTCQVFGLRGGYSSNSSTSLKGNIAEIHPGEVTETGCIRHCDQLKQCGGFEHIAIQSVCVLFTDVSGSFYKPGTSAWVKCSLDGRNSETAADPQLPSVVGANGVEEVNRNGYVGPRQLCSYSEPEIADLLKKDHGCSHGELNTVWRGHWIYFGNMQNNDFYKDDVECVVTCTHKRRPCPDGTCLFPLYLRKSTTDARVAYQMLEEDNLTPLNAIKSFHNILDAGANLGSGAAIFATMYPEATIVSVEPSTSNFEALRRNTERFKNVIRVHAGLWPRTAHLSLVQDPNQQGEWAFEVMESTKVAEGYKVLDGLIGVSVPFILDNARLDYFEFAKIDIEGSELELFKPGHNDMSWLKNLRLAVLELHEHMRKGSQQAVNAVLTSGEWRYLFTSGEEAFFAKPEIKRLLHHHI